MPLIVLAIAAVIFYLYYLLVQWMFTMVAPEVLVTGALLGTLSVPVIYAIAVRTQFDIQQERNWMWGLIFVLLGFTYVDFAAVFFHLLSSLGIESWVAIKVSPYIEWVHTKLPGNRALVALGEAILAGTDDWLFADFVSILGKSLAIVCFLLIARGLKNRYKDTDQPAIRQYFFGQAFVDLEGLLEVTTKQFISYYESAFEWSSQKIRSIDEDYLVPMLICTWPILLAIFVAIVISTVFAVINLIILLSVHGLALGIVAAASAALALFLYLIEQSILLVRSGYTKCPHAQCNETLKMPTFQCGACGEKHDKLIPGRCGVLQRECVCGEKLPTFSWFGKQALVAYCPHCDNRILKALFTANVHVPIFGGPSAGKTMFMIANTWQLLEGQVKDVAASLIDKQQERTYRQVWKKDIETGRTAAKTTARWPDAVLLSVKRTGGEPVSIYIYDPAGETLENEGDLGRQRYLRHFDSMAIMIDPLSFTTLAERYAEKGGKLPPTTCRTPPEAVVQRVVTALEKQGGLSRSRRYRRRMAIVITKADSDFVQKQIGVGLAKEATREQNWRDINQAESVKIESWLKHNEPEFLQLLTTHFSDLRFFLVSAMGHDDKVRESLHPRRVLEPLLWLISTRWSLAWPVAIKAATRVAEVAIVVLLVIAFMVVPYTLNATTKNWAAEVGERLDTHAVHRRIVESNRTTSAAVTLTASTPTAAAPNSVSKPAVPRLMVVVTATAANARALPSMQGKIVQVIPRNQRLRVTGRDGGWYRVVLPPPNQKRVAWMYKSVVRIER